MTASFIPDPTRAHLVEEVLAMHDARSKLWARTRGMTFLSWPALEELNYLMHDASLDEVYAVLDALGPQAGSA
jgi:hypothetical protein